MRILLEKVKIHFKKYCFNEKLWLSLKKQEKKIKRFVNNKI